MALVKGRNEDRLDQNQLELMQKANGILGWLAQVSKPDLAYAYVEFSSILKRATLGDAKRLIRMLKKARSDLDTIKFSNLGDLVTVEGEGGAMAIFYLHLGIFSFCYQWRDQYWMFQPG